MLQVVEYRRGPVRVPPLAPKPADHRPFRFTDWAMI